MAFLFNNPLLYALRARNSLDPFIAKPDSRLIVNNQIILSELPDEFSGVTISGYSESKTNTNLTSSMFYVNYLNGIISFSSSENGKTVVANYFGKGIIQIPGQRIYYTDALNNVAGNFQDLAVSINSVVPAENLRISAESTRQTSETTRINSENTRISNENSRISIENTRVSNENTRLSNESSRQTAENTRVSNFTLMINSSKMILQNPVATFTSIATTYPSPLVYWTVRTIDDGKLYRYDGTTWIWIDTLNTTVYDTLVQNLNSNNSVTTDTQMILSMGGMI